MQRRDIITAATATFAAVAPLAAVAEKSTAPARDRVVIQVSDDDPKKWNLALNNAHNLAADVGVGNVDIDIVIFGPGIGMLQFDSVVGTRVAQAISQGMRVYACENTMRALKLEVADMLPNIRYVPAGVTHIVRQQANGWSYLRP